MKGFYIDVTNNLLDPKHKKAIGSAVWEFMWCLDKITSVNENGVGKVLGGKPVKWEDLVKEFGGAVSTVSSNMQKLKKGGYITLRRTPFGNVITVNKAKKRFGGTTKNKKSDSDYEKTEDGLRKSGSQTTKKRVNKEDNTIGQDNKTSELGSQVNKLIDGFKEVNPSFTKLYRNTTQRKSCENMIKLHGFEKMLQTVLLLPKINKIKYLPIVTTPYELEDKLGKVVAGLQKLKEEKLSGASKAIW